jgi:hypothetical protein
MEKNNMAVKNFITRLLGLHDQEQKARTEAVLDYGNKKREEFEKEMTKVHAQATRVNKKQLQAQAETAKLIEVVDSVTAKIMVATGGKIR